MTRRADKYNVPDSLLLELFMHQMPPNVQSILASVEPLDSSKAASIADRILLHPLRSIANVQNVLRQYLNWWQNLLKTSNHILEEIQSETASKLEKLSISCNAFGIEEFDFFLHNVIIAVRHFNCCFL
ncbi:uncharacterized protein LOC118205529 [Stegodyphus dumicola]|uniref:uncharacterized protein LOC118205529 n=1 Tax=Stegodyphus dumicola TaxID=202533 RepID=UPI0015A8315A|nr:uncharacterized protein LOC118205529 [Stegodyphus dumicola]